MELRKIDTIANNAKDVLEQWDIEQKLSFDAMTGFYRRYNKTEVSEIFRITRGKLSKIVEEMEENGHAFERVSGGATTRIKFTVEDIVAIYKYQGGKVFRERFGKAYTVFVGNLKGGVAKTISTVTIAHALRTHTSLIQEDLRILIVDLDPQASATMMTNGDCTRPDLETTATQAMLNCELTKEELMEKYVFPTQVSNVSVMPSNISDGFIAAHWDEITESEEADFKGHKIHKFEALKKNVIAKLEDEFDFIFIDTGPHMDSMLLNALVASDMLMTPVPLDRVDLHSTLTYLMRLPEEIDYLKEEFGMDVKFKTNIGFMSKVTNKQLETKTPSYVRQTFGADILDASFKYLSAFANVTSDRQTVISEDPNDYLHDRKALNNAKSEAYKFSKAVFDRIIVTRKAEGAQ